MSKINDWLEKDKLILLEGWARDGLTDEQIAKNIGINRTTLYDWKKKEINIADALKKGKDVVDLEVENALLKKALGYTITIEEEKIDRDGFVHTLKRDIHFPPDTGAIVFWLKNRQTKKWRDKVEIADNDAIKKLDELLEAQKNA